MDTKIIQMLISFVVSFFLSSCMQGPSFLSQKISDKDDELNLTYEENSTEVTMRMVILLRFQLKCLRVCLQQVVS